MDEQANRASAEGPAEPGHALIESATELANALNAYESHRLSGIQDAAHGVRVAPHDDARSCSDESLHDPWRDVVARWPNFSSKQKARPGDLHVMARRELLTGAEVAVLADGGREVVVRYVATDHRWVVDEPPLAGG